MTTTENVYSAMVTQSKVYNAPWEYECFWDESTPRIRMHDRIIGLYLLFGGNLDHLTEDAYLEVWAGC